MEIFFALFRLTRLQVEWGPLRGIWKNRYVDVHCMKTLCAFWILREWVNHRPAPHLYCVCNSVCPLLEIPLHTHKYIVWYHLIFACGFLWFAGGGEFPHCCHQAPPTTRTWWAHRTKWDSATGLGFSQEEVRTIYQTATYVWSNVINTNCFTLPFYVYSSGARRGTYAAGGGGVGGRRRGRDRPAASGQSGHSANSGDSLADDDEEA